MKSPQVVISCVCVSPPCIDCCCPPEHPSHPLLPLRAQLTRLFSSTRCAPSALRHPARQGRHQSYPVRREGRRAHSALRGRRRSYAPQRGRAARQGRRQNKNNTEKGEGNFYPRLCAKGGGQACFRGATRCMYSLVLTQRILPPTGSFYNNGWGILTIFLRENHVSRIRYMFLRASPQGCC